MSTHLADLRDDISDVEQAKLLLSEIATATAALEASAARVDHQIAILRDTHEHAVAPIKTQIRDMEDRLLRFILGNKHLFKRPRKVKTANGSFGLQRASRIKINNQDKLLEYLMDRGYDDCMTVVRKPVRDAIRTRIEDGEHIPHVTNNSGDIAVCNVDKELLRKARQDALS